MPEDVELMMDGIIPQGDVPYEDSTQEVFATPEEEFETKQFGLSEEKIE